MKSYRLLVTTAAVGALAFASVGPASAAVTGPTTTTFEVTAGALSITMPASANLGTRANSLVAGSVSGPLGQVQVTDARGGTTGWVASVISTAFTPASTPATAIPATSVDYTFTTPTPVGTATLTQATGLANADFTGVVPILTATDVTGTNSATWNPTITVAVPALTPTGVYTATITHSVA